MSPIFDQGGPDKDRPDKDLPDEQQLEEYLRGGSDVSRQYRQLPGAEVPDELDRLVLRQAQEAVKARPAKSRTWMRWTGPLALAASAVLVVSIVIESGVHEDKYLSVPASAPAEVSTQESARNSAKQSAAETDDATVKATAGVSDESSVVHIMPRSESRQEVPIPEVIVPAEPVPAAEEQSLAIQPMAPQPTSAPQFSSPPPPQVDNEPRQGARLERSNAIPQANVRRVAPVPTPAPAPAAVSTEARVRDLDTSAFEEAVVTANKRSEQKRTVGPRSTIAAPAAADSASDAAEEEGDQPRNYSDPEQWLRDIRELRKANKHQEADREWRRFRYVFPNYEVADNDLARGATR